jgi:hypothetical protein
MPKKKSPPKRELTPAEALRELETKRGQAYAGLAQMGQKRSMPGLFDAHSGRFWGKLILLLIAVGVVGWFVWDSGLLE